VVRAAIGLDVGGTKIAAFRVTDSGEIEERAMVPTPETTEDIFETMRELAAKVATSDVAAIGVGAPGMVEFAEGIVRYAPNLPWRDLPLASRLSDATGLPCVVDNDATVAAWGEYRFGAGSGSTDMLMVTVGTGIGGGIVTGGKIFRGAHGFAAEIGHIIVEPDGPLCGCGNRGCLEQVAAGRAIDRLGRDAARDHPEALFVQLAGGDPATVDGRAVTEAARRGDEMALEILSEVGRRLGEGMAGLANTLDPEVIVVGGGAIAAGDLLLGPARTAFTEAVEAVEVRPEIPIRAALLGNEAGAVGAAVLALEELLPA
jgi:glucokinase